MNRAWTIILPAVMLAGLFAVGHMNSRLVDARRTSGITQADPVINAPPLVVFTTVALGGFRGIIADFLWIRSARLQYQGKYFELVQLADWITKLEPRFTEVWAYHAWNLAYNISVLFTDHGDRWRWVRHGFSLLRDQGLVYNPDEAQLLVELGWIFQHKIGGSSDDAHLYYKQAWAEEMTQVLGGGRPDYDNMPPETVRILREQYKLDPGLMRRIEAECGPLDWRMPPAHAIYWATRSRSVSSGRDILFAERMIYQSMADAFRQGRYVQPSEGGAVLPTPHLELLPYAMAAHERAIEVFGAVPGPRESYRNFLTEAAVTLFIHGMDADAAAVIGILSQREPEVPADIAPADFATVSMVRRHAPARDPVAAAIAEAEHQQAFYQAAGDMVRATGYGRLAEAIRNRADLLVPPPDEVAE